MAYELTVEELRRRLGEADELQIHLQMSRMPGTRIEVMLDFQYYVMTSWKNRLEKRFPEKDQMEITQLVYHHLRQND